MVFYAGHVIQRLISLNSQRRNCGQLKKVSTFSSQLSYSYRHRHKGQPTKTPMLQLDVNTEKLYVYPAFDERVSTCLNLDLNPSL